MFSPNNQSIKSINSSQHESPLIFTWSFYNTRSIFCESFFTFTGSFLNTQHLLCCESFFAFMWSFFNTYNIHHVSSFAFSWRFFFNHILETCFRLEHHHHVGIHWILLLLNNIYHHQSNQMWRNVTYNNNFLTRMIDQLTQANINTLLHWHGIVYQTIDWLIDWSINSHQHESPFTLMRSLFNTHSIIGIPSSHSRHWRLGVLSSLTSLWIQLVFSPSFMGILLSHSRGVNFYSHWHESPSQTHIYNLFFIVGRPLQQWKSSTSTSPMRSFDTSQNTREERRRIQFHTNFDSFSIFTSIKVQFQVFSTSLLLVFFSSSRKTPYTFD